MRSFNDVPGASGVVAIVIGSLAVSAIITFVTGSVVHWLPIIAGIIIGLMAVKSINR